MVPKHHSVCPKSSAQNVDVQTVWVGEKFVRPLDTAEKREFAGDIVILAWDHTI